MIRMIRMIRSSVLAAAAGVPHVRNADVTEPAGENPRPWCTSGIRIEAPRSIRDVPEQELRAEVVGRVGAP